MRRPLLVNDEHVMYVRGLYVLMAALAGALVIALMELQHCRSGGYIELPLPPNYVPVSSSSQVSGDSGGGGGGGSRAAAAADDDAAFTGAAFPKARSVLLSTMPSDFQSGKLSYDRLYKDVKSAVKAEELCLPSGVGRRRCWKRLAMQDGSESIGATGPEYDTAVMIAKLAAKLPKEQLPRSVFFDVGLNAGVFTTLAASLGLTVHSFDPQPACIALACEGLALNAGDEAKPLGRVFLHNVAVSGANVPAPLAAKAKAAPGDKAVSASDGTTSKLGTLEAQLDVCHPGFSFPAAQHQGTKAAEATTVVKRLPLGHYLSKLRGKPVFVLKISECQIGEVGVLSSLMAPIEKRRVHHLFVEAKPLAWHSKGVVPAEGRELFARLAELAKEVVLIDRKAAVAGPEELRQLLAAQDDATAGHLHLYFRFV